MTASFGADLWAFATIAGVIILGAGFVFGTWQWRHRNRKLDATREAATRDNYRRENRVE